MTGEQELEKDFHWLADQWNKRVKEVMGKEYRGGVYWTWDSLGTTNIEFAVWKGDTPIGSEWVSLGPMSESWEEDWQDFAKTNHKEDLKAEARLERELWGHEIENLGSDFIYYPELEKLLQRFKKGDVPNGSSPHYGATNPYAKFVEFNASTQGPYYGGH
jgi:hypothetical protein